MAMRRLLRPITALAFVLVGGCDEPFNPVEDFQPQMIIYGMLETTRDTQYVRVSSSYDPPEHNPANQTTDSALTGTSVVVIGGTPANGTTVFFQPTLLTRWNNDRYTTPVPAFVAPGFRVERGGIYSLFVSSPLGQATASVTVPTVSYVFTADDMVLRAPQNSPRNREINFRSILSPVTYGFFMRLLVDYEVAVPGGWEARTIEIPRTLLRDDSIATMIGTYPQLRRRTTQGVTTTTERETFFAGPYFRIVQLLRQRYKPAGALRFLRARAILYQTDEAFYRYVKTVNGFNDQFTIRTDEPDVSNITNGRGLFAIVTTDTSTVTLPDVLGL
ncbi:MAG: DUF4249 family protein [Bacteroidota bacterium]